MSNSETFSLQLAAFVAKAKAAPEQVVRQVTSDLLKAVVYRTPVGNPTLWAGPAPKGYVGGRLRANWNVSLDEPDTSTTDAIDAGGGATIDRGINVVASVGDNQDVYITNSLPYAIPIEYGHSAQQAPAGMVRVSVAEAQAFVNAAVASLPK